MTALTEQSALKPAGRRHRRSRPALIVAPGNKLCIECLTEKPFSEFPPNQAVKDGHGSYCRACQRVKTSRSRAKLSREQRQRKDKAQYSKYRKKLLADPQAYQRHLDKARIRNKARWSVKKKAIIAQRRARRNSDPVWRALHNMRRRLVFAVHGIGKASNTMQLLGCTKEFLRQHLESQFTPEMSWSNYGTYWQVDHRKPCAEFDLSKPGEQRLCFHYKNLRPLPAVINLSRGGTLRHTL